MPELPPIEFGAYLVPILMEIGPGVATGMGNAPITCEQINPWCQRMGIDLRPWETRWLIRLSKEHLAESQKASKHFAEPPWEPETF